jgi:hypothetical protein
VYYEKENFSGNIAKRADERPKPPPLPLYKIPAVSARMREGTFEPSSASYQPSQRQQQQQLQLQQEQQEQQQWRHVQRLQATAPPSPLSQIVGNRNGPQYSGNGYSAPASNWAASFGRGTTQVPVGDLMEKGMGGGLSFSFVVA